MSRPPDGAPWPTASTRAVVLLGWPARYSLSPVIHNAAFREHGLDLVYLVTPVPAGQLPEVVHALGVAGIVGANVTVPHKLAAFQACDHHTEEAALIGAVNTLSWGAQGLLGDNTDAVGLRDAITADVAVRPGDRYVVIGTGGAARAAVVAVGRLEGAVTVLGRRPAAAAELAVLAQQAGAAVATSASLEDDTQVAAAVGEARIVCNATPLGMLGESLPAPLHALTPGQVAYDLVYDPPETAFLRSARARGVEGHNGLGMLVGQAAASYRRWTGREAPVEVMSAAATGALLARHRADVAAVVADRTEGAATPEGP